MILSGGLEYNVLTVITLLFEDEFPVPVSTPSTFVEVPPVTLPLATTFQPVCGGAANVESVLAPCILPPERCTLVFAIGNTYAIWTSVLAPFFQSMM